MEPVTEELLKRITDAIVEELHPLKIILFGSQARGDAGSHSDVDLLIVEEGPFVPGNGRRDHTARLYRKLADIMVPIDFLVYQVTDFVKWSSARNHVVAHAIKEGRVLYERS